MKILKKIRVRVEADKFFSFIAMFSMLMNVASPFAAMYPVKAFAEDVVTETTSSDAPKETPASDPVTTTETPKEEPAAVETPTQTTQETPTNEPAIVTTEPTITETPAVTQPEAPADAQPGDILPDGASDYRPQADVTAMETPQTQESADPTALPSTTEPVAATDVSGTEPAIVVESSGTEPATLTDSSEPATEPVAPVETPKEYETLADGVEIKNSVESDWKVDGDIAVTNEVVKLGVKYIFPLDKDVTITFTKLPKLDSDRTSLKIERVKVSDLNLPDGVNTDAQYAFDVTTGMKDGDFKYDITLPKPENKEVGISYIEKSVEEAKSEVKADEVKVIDESKVEQQDGDSTAKVSDLDHFTIFIATYADMGLFTSEATYLQGDMVYVSSSSLSSGNYYKIDIIEQNGSTRHPAVTCTTGATTLSGSYLLSVSAPVGTNWKAEITKYNSLSDCNAQTSIKDTGTKTFGVKATSPVALANPAINPPCCGLDIALVIDNSNSIDSTELSQMKAALIGFVNALAGTPNEFSVTKFGTSATVVHGFTSTTADVISAINSISTGGGGTNWKEGIIAARGTFNPDPRPTKPNLMIFASDGNPTYPSCGGATTCAADVNAAVTEANIAKSSPYNIRILTLGIGDGLLVENLKAISGHVVNGSTIMGSDVITTDFSGMATQLANFAKQTCGGTITVNKFYDDLSHKGGTGWTFNVAGSTKTTDSNGQTDAVTVSAGNTVSVIETGLVSGYAFGSASCKKSTGDSVGSAVTNGVGGITVGTDDIISCNFINTTNKGSITIVKDAQPDNAQDFSFTTTGGLTPASFSLDDDNDATLSNSRTFNGLNPGTYTVTEGTTTGWTLGNISCSTGGTPDLASGKATIVITPGLSVTCTYTNTVSTGTLIVKKTVVNDNGGTLKPENFSFKVNGGSAVAFEADGQNDLTVNAGTYSVTEVAVTGYTTSYNNCNSLNVPAGGSVTCTITNNDIQPLLKVTKIVDGGTAHPGDFDLFVGPTQVISGAVNGFNVGTYHVAEDKNSILGYTTVTYSGACDQTGYVTLNIGDSKECVITNTRDLGHLKVQKVVDYGNVTDWSFSLDGATSIQADTQGIVDFGQVTTLDHHTITETGPSSSDFTTVITGTNCSSVQGTSGVATATVVKGGTTTCTFNNSVNKGTITIIKDATPNSEQDFNFVTSGNGISNFTLDDDGDNSNTYSNTKSFSNLLPRYYSISETPVTGWNQSVVVCDSTDGQDTLGIGSVGISLSANEHVTCTFTNTGVGKIRVIKNTTGGDTSFGFYLSDVTGAPITSSTVSTVGGYAEKDFIDLNPGTYSVLETYPQSWFMSSASCVDQAGAPVGGSPVHNAIYGVTVNPGSEITCTFDNTKYGRIIIDKVTDPSGDPQSFTLTYKKGDVIHDVYLTDKTDPFDTAVFPGVWEISESSVSGWSLSNITCTDPDGQTVVDLTNGKALADIAAGETVSCTFTNSKVPTLTVTKILDPSNDRGLFNLFIDGNGVATDAGNNFISNPLRVDIGYNHQVSETAGIGTNLENYTATYGGDCDSKGQITLAAGDNKNCTITNTLKRASVALGKCNDLNGDGGDCDGPEPMLSGWTLFLDKNGDGILNGSEQSGVTNHDGMVYLSSVLPGDYGLCEVEQAGWVRTRPADSNCKSITINPGDSIAYYFANKRAPVTVNAYKIVCTNEADLPNWGTGGPDITSSTAQDWINTHKSCKFESGWDFQWGYSNAPNPGDNTGVSSDPKWFNFGQPTGSNGMTSVSISDLGDTPYLWVREAWKPNYIPFTYGIENSSNRNNISAEMYCHVDVLNYDNWDRVDGVQYGNTYYCVAWNVPDYGKVIVNKFQDNNKNGFRDESEPLLSGWNITLDQFTQVTNEGGSTTFTNLFPGTYGMTEPVIPTGWIQTNMYCDNNESREINDSNQLNVTVGAGQTVNCYIGNVPVNPKLHICKENNTGGADKRIGDRVTFTIRVRGSDSSLKGVRVVDLLPKGFKFVTGSSNWSVVSDMHGALSIPDPSYASPGTWNIGNLDEGETVTITYEADVGSSVEPGLYKDLAWTSGKNIIDAGVLGLAENPGELNTYFVGTEVNVVQDQAPLKDTVDVKEKTKQKEEVLGASTSRLPATGASATFINVLLVIGSLGGLLMIVGGVGQMLKNRNRKIKNAKMGKALLTMLALGFSLILAGKVYAETDANLIARIEKPKSPANSYFNVNFVVLDATFPARHIDAECWKKGPSDADFVKFSDVTVDGSGGNTNNCIADGSVLTQDGTYGFKVKVRADSGPWQDSINTESVVYDGTGPDKPKSIEKDKKSSCKYEVTVKTADDGQTSYVQIYRDFSKEMDLNAGNLIKTKTLGPNEKYTFTDELYGSDCGHTPYYAVVAFDASGNASDPRAEEVVTTVTITKTTETQTVLGAVAVPGGANLPGEGTTQGAGTGTGTGTGEGQGAGSGSVLGENVQNAVGGSILKSPWFWLPIILVIIVGGVIIKGKKKA